MCARRCGRGLQDDVNLVRVVDRRELRAQQDAVGVGVVEAAAVDILMHDDDAPFRVRVRFDGFLDECLVIRRVVVVRVDDDEKRIAIGVEIAVAGSRRRRFFRERIRHVEVVLVADGHAVMVANACGLRQAAQRLGGEVARVLHLLQLDLFLGLVLRGLIDLVARGDEEVDLWGLGERAVERLVPVVGIVAGCKLAVLLVALRRRLALRGADLRVADIHEREVVRIARLERCDRLPVAVDLHLIVIRRLRLEAAHRHFVRIVLRAGDERSFLGSAAVVRCVRHIFMRRDADDGILRLLLGRTLMH